MKNVFTDIFVLGVFQLTTSDMAGETSKIQITSPLGETAQELEISDLKSSFDGKVTDIRGVGDFTHVLSLRPANMEMQCKFQLSASYPKEAPQVSVRSSVLSTEEVADLVQFLQTASQALVGQPMILEVMKKGLEWLKNNNINADFDQLLEEKGKKKGKHKKRSKGGKEKQEENQEEEVTKKPPMKTASDVIKRLQWDQDVEKEEFIVGYMDRIVGLQERRFTDFTWEDLASVDQFALAIPQHRIQYFKYKTVKVWDKNERLDDVFGSTGSGITITEAVAKYETTIGVQEGAAKNDANVDSESDEADDEEGYCHDEICEEFIRNKAEDKENDKLNEACGVNSDGYSINANGNAEEGLVNKSGAATGNTSHKREKESNFFLGLKLQDEDTVENLVDVQRQVIELYPFYKDHAMSKNSFHLTLRLLSLRSDDEIRTCASVMKKISDKVREKMQKIEALSFKGLDHFGPNVIYVRVKYTAAFMELLDYITRKFEDAGVNVVSHQLVPHVTLFKVPRAKRERGKTQPPMLLRFNNLELGAQPVDNIHVCQMGTLTETSDFYTIASSIELQE